MENDYYLKQAYKLKTEADTLNLYENWADSYERTLADQGYVTPKRCAEALSIIVADTSVPSIDEKPTFLSATPERPVPHPISSIGAAISVRWRDKASAQRLGVT